ncbi:Uncharacterised protein [Serratia fonticola]|uniref:Uncharacterized protein n=1 Tax=Serratia fonticola TaxID=47917 RepID=A0A4V6KVQ3_SERFO|nr:Uncharacterised protein [Serratia fonticola]
MKFSEQEIKPVWDEVARLIGDSVMQLRHRGEELSVESLSKQLAQHLAESHDIEAAHPDRCGDQHAERGKVNRQPKWLAIL